MSSGTLFLDPDLRVRREDHSDRLLCGVFGALIRMLAPPRLDARPVTFHRRASGAGADSNAFSTASAATFDVGSIFDTRQTIKCPRSESAQSSLAQLTRQTLDRRRGSG
jgi:hypothetical protein